MVVDSLSWSLSFTTSSNSLCFRGCMAGKLPAAPAKRTWRPQEGAQVCGGTIHYLRVARRSWGLGERLAAVRVSVVGAPENV